MPSTPAPPPQLGSAPLGPALLALLVLGTTSALARSEPRDLDLAFVIDTTGSMSSEIREAKERVHEIYLRLAESRPGRRVRFGVVAYRDRGDAYLTRVSPLSEDIEVGFEALSTLSAGGGGDTPEDLLSGLVAALSELGWDESDGVDRELFVIGDAPPKLAYEELPSPEQIFEEARRRRIVMHSIGCRSLSGSGRSFFRRIAYETEGRYHHVGRVELGAELSAAPSLADAVVSTLAAREPEEPLRRPLDLQPVERGPAPPGHGLRVERFSGADEDDPADCGLRLALPAGLALSRPPRAELAGEILVVGLALASGQGEEHRFTLSPCPPATAPIRVVLED